METEKVEDRIRRFNDVFKLTLTLLAIAVSLGLKEFEVMFSFGTVFWYFLCLTIWAIGHLRGGDFEVTLKLISWYLLIFFLPIIYLPFMIRKRPQFYDLAIVLLCTSLLLYLATWKYLATCLKNSLARKIMLWIPAIVSVYFIVSEIFVRLLFEIIPDAF